MNDTQALDQLIEAVTVDCYGLEEQVAAFQEAFNNEVSLPAETAVLDMPVQVVAFGVREDGNDLTALCRRGDVEQELSLADLRFEPQSVVGWLHAAYRRCLGLRPHPATKPPDWELAD